MSALWQKLRTTSETHGVAVVGQRPPWRAKSAWAAFALMLLGGGLWINDQLKQKDAPAPTPPEMETFTRSPNPGAELPSAGKPSLNPSSPAMFRLGASYLGGFFLGWAFRRFLKLTMLLSAAVIGLLVLAKWLGWFEVDWASIGDHVKQSLAWAKSEAGAVKTFFTGYLPSAGAAAVGAFLGFWRK